MLSFWQLSVKTGETFNQNDDTFNLVNTFNRVILMVLYAANGPGLVRILDMAVPIPPQSRLITCCLSGRQDRELGSTNADMNHLYLACCQLLCPRQKLGNMVISASYFHDIMSENCHGTYQDVHVRSQTKLPNICPDFIDVRAVVVEISGGKFPYCIQVLLYKCCSKNP